MKRLLTVILFLLISIPAQAGTIIGTPVIGGVDSWTTSVTNYTISSTTAGDSIIVGLACGTGTTTFGVSDATNGAYTQGRAINSGVATAAAGFYRHNTAAGVTTVSVTSTTTCNGVAWIFIVRGLANSAPSAGDQTNLSGTAHECSSVGLSVTSGFSLCAAMQGAGVTNTESAGWTKATNVNAARFAMYRTTTIAADQGAFTSASTDGGVAILMAFADAAAPSSTTYYVSTSGSNGNSCVTATSPGIAAKLTITNALMNCMNPGDILRIQVGVYAESFNNIVPSGTVGNPITIRADNLLAKPTVRPSAGNVPGFLFNADNYITLLGIIIDGVNISGLASNGIKVENGSAHLIFDSIEIYNVNSGSGTTQSTPFLSSGKTTAPPQDIILRNSIINRAGGIDQNSVCVYINATDDFLAEDNQLISCNGYGFHIYTSSGIATDSERTILRRNKINGNGFLGRSCIILSATTNALAENNECWASYGCIRVGSTDGVVSVTSSVIHNTCVSNTSEGIYLTAFASGTKVYNNIFYLNTGAGNCYSDSATGNVGVTTGAGACTNSSGGNLIGVNPSFTNAAGGDFTIPSTSAARDIGLSAATTGTTLDIIGATRDATPDAGSHEYIASAPPTSPPGNPISLGRRGRR